MLTPDLVNALLEFRRLRNWEQFHTTRNLASALSVEAAELLEHFVWANDQQIPDILKERRATIMAEVADIAILLTYLAHDLSIDLEAVVSEKMAANERKYPLERVMNLGENRIEMRIPRSAWFPCDLRFPHS
jgi:dCTP diphosphatase